MAFTGDCTPIVVAVEFTPKEDLPVPDEPGSLRAGEVPNTDSEPEREPIERSSARCRRCLRRVGARNLGLRGFVVAVRDKNLLIHSLAFGTCLAVLNGNFDVPRSFRDRIPGGSERYREGAGSEALATRIGIPLGLSLNMSISLDAWLARGALKKRETRSPDKKPKFEGLSGLEVGLPGALSQQASVSGGVPGLFPPGGLGADNSVASSMAENMRKARGTDNRIPGHERAITCIAFGAHRVFTGVLSINLTFEGKCFFPLFCRVTAVVGDDDFPSRLIDCGFD